jgi:DNA-binding response OmpR family regulator
MARMLNSYRYGGNTVARKVVFIMDAQADDPRGVGPVLGALSEMGALAELFTDWPDALRRAAFGAADLLVIDLDTPSLGGLETQIQIGRIASRIPVLLLSAEDNKARRMWAVEAGIVGYATKPIDGQALLRFIAKVLRGTRVS